MNKVVTDFLWIVKNNLLCSFWTRLEFRFKAWNITHREQVGITALPKDTSAGSVFILRRSWTARLRTVCCSLDHPATHTYRTLSRKDYQQFFPLLLCTLVLLSSCPLCSSATLSSYQEMSWLIQFQALLQNKGNCCAQASWAESTGNKVQVLCESAFQQIHK